MVRGNDSVFEKLIDDVQTFDLNTPIGSILPQVKKNGAAVVTRDGEYYGIIDTGSIHRFGSESDLNKSSSESVSIKAPWIGRNTSLDEVIRDFYKSRTNALAYLSGKKVKGMLRRQTLLKVLLSTGALKGIKTGEAMTASFVSIDSGASIAEAKSLMKEKDVNRLVVMENNKFVGIATNHDITFKYSARDERRPEMRDSKYDLKKLPLSDIIQRNADTISSSSVLSDAARKMVENKISSIVVTDGSSPVGVITTHNIFESVIMRRQVEPPTIFLSGFDSLDYDYNSEVRDELGEFMNRLERSKNIPVDYITLHVKRIKIKSYELTARLSMGGSGMLNVSAEGYIFEDVMHDLMEKLRKDTDKMRSLYITKRRSGRDAKGY
jgi:CBS domain-containing protein